MKSINCVVACNCNCSGVENTCGEKPLGRFWWYRRAPLDGHLRRIYLGAVHWELSGTGQRTQYRPTEMPIAV